MVKKIIGMGAIVVGVIIAVIGIFLKVKDNSNINNRWKRWTDLSFCCW